MKRILTAGLMMAGLLAGSPSAQAADVTHLRCEYLVNPLGIDVLKPRLSWKIEVRGQNAYEWNCRGRLCPSPICDYRIENEVN